MINRNMGNATRRNGENLAHIFREPLIIMNLSLPRKRESSNVKRFWIPAFAGMTFLEVTFILKGVIYGDGFKEKD
jgi:hypothetical protein